MKLSELVDDRRDLMVRLADNERRITLELAAGHQQGQHEPDLLTAKVAARKLGIAPVTLYERARVNEIPSVRIGRAVRFRSHDIQDYSNRKVAS
jgi:excisionase family DNA binding protein